MIGELLTGVIEVGLVTPDDVTWVGHDELRWGI